MTEEQTNIEEPQEQDEQAQERPEPVNVAEYQAEVQRLRDDLAKVRKEAADRRVKAKELEDKLAQTKSLDEYNALKEELAAAARKAEHDRLVATYAGSLPDDLKSSVSWPEDEDGIKALARKLSVYQQVDGATPSGGLGQRQRATDSDADYDPRQIASRLTF